jgi:hypothetical protein
MKIAIVYAFVNTGDAERISQAVRFIETYNANPPGMDHDSVVVLNGHGNGLGFAAALFASLPNLTILQHDNSGWDIGAFQMAARTIPCDLMLFFGASAWIPKPGWMKRVYESCQTRGLGLFGCHGNQGVGSVFPHVRTTGFWINPELLNRYPHQVTEPGQRYPFEHGSQCVSKWVREQGLGVWVVGWDGEYPLERCNSMPNGIHRGDQSNLLFRDRLTDPPFYF